MTSVDRELLLSRVVDRRAELSDWDSLMSQAGTDADLWRQLALALRDDDLLRLSLDAELAGVPAVEAPEPAVRGWSIGWRALSGWAAAALLSLAWWLDGPAVVVSPSVGDSQADRPVVELDSSRRGAEVAQPAVVSAGARRGATAENGAALADATSAGEAPVVLGEVGRELLETRASPDGRGIEVLYLRQELVREVVDEVFELSRDELGLPRPVPVPAARLTASEVL